ncbi:hypothetical protein ACIGCP_11510 [Cellulophaga baltica]|uniref:hypothetical protein n=1 Tax=Cellulophaga baltica TaxID=76594 RepID=UPI0037CB8B91
MQLSIKGFIKSKESELFYDCADRFAYDKNNHKFSISDGVSKSFFPKIWADILVHTWVNEDWKTDIDFINSCQKKWLKNVTEIVQKSDAKWFTKNAFNRREPALATFIGLSFHFRNNDYSWKAQALGDSFLFFVPKHFIDFEKEIEVVSSKESPILFDNFPDYLASLGSSHKGEKKIVNGNLKEGCFYLMTDALAEWFLNEKENAINRINVWTGQKDFEHFIDEERLSKRLGNDDSAILIITVKKDGKDGFNYSEENIANINDLIKTEQSALKLKESQIPTIQNKSKINSATEVPKENEDVTNTVSENNKEECVEEINESKKAADNSINSTLENKQTLDVQKKIEELAPEQENLNQPKKDTQSDNGAVIKPAVKPTNSSQKITDKF